MQPLRDRSSLDGLPRPRPLRRSRTSSWKSARSRSWSDKWPTTLRGCGNARRREISVGAGKVARGSWSVGCSVSTASGGCSSCVSVLYQEVKPNAGRLTTVPTVVRQPDLWLLAQEPSEARRGRPGYGPGAGDRPLDLVAHAPCRVAQHRVGHCDLVEDDWTRPHRRYPARQHAQRPRQRFEGAFFRLFIRRCSSC